jgi:hypothetical protein
VINMVDTSPAMMFAASIMVNMLLLCTLTIVHIWNPYAFRLAWAKRIVFIIQRDMDIIPVSAWDEGGAYVTDDHGRFNFDRKDVVRYGRKPAIFALEWMTRAIRPDCVQGLDFLRKHKVKSFDEYEARYVKKEHPAPVVNEIHEEPELEPEPEPIPEQIIITPTGDDY